MKGFIKFIREQGVVGLAIGFMMGGAVSKVVSAFVSDIVNPIVSALFKDMESLAESSISVGSAEILWGDFVVVFIDFLIIAAVIYFLFKGLGLEKLDKKKN
ncbi:MAG: MscL family protein, partial [Candidatus Paceibacterota bacterium]